MKLYDNEQQAIIGINVELTTQDQIILKDAIQEFKDSLAKTQNKKFNETCRVDTQALRNLVTFIDKITDNVPSMKDAYNELFDIEEDDEVKMVGKINLD